MRSFRTRATAIAASLLVVGGVGVVHLDSASATGVPCPSGRICLYDTSDVWNTTRYIVPTGTGYKTLSGQAINNRTSYIINNSGYHYTVYTDTYCRNGNPGPIYKNSRGPMLGGWNNSISCVRR
jgi:hypothetical protein